MKITGKKSEGFNYDTEEQKRIHLFLINILDAFQQADLNANQLKIESFYQSPSLAYAEKKYSQSELRKIYTNLRDLKTFKGKVVFWLKTVYFGFSESEIKALFAKATEMKNNGSMSTDDFLFYAITAQPKDYIQDDLIPRQPAIKKVSEKEKVEFDF